MTMTTNITPWSPISTITSMTMSMTIIDVVFQVFESRELDVVMRLMEVQRQEESFKASLRYQITLELRKFEFDQVSDAEKWMVR